MHNILAGLSVSITELKKNPSAIIKEAEGDPIAILNNNRPTAYIIPADTYEDIIEVMEDHYLGRVAMKRLAEEEDLAEEVDIEEL